SFRYFVNSHAALALGNQAQRLFCPKVENPSRRTPALRYSCDQRSTLVWPTNPALWTFVVVVVGGSRSTVFSSLNGFGAIRLLPTMYSWRLLRTLMLFPTTISPEKSGFTWYGRGGAGRGCLSGTGCGGRPTRRTSSGVMPPFRIRRPGSRDAARRPPQWVWPGGGGGPLRGRVRCVLD